MKVFRNIEQGSLEWLLMRSSIPTASEFSQIVTSAKCELSASCDKYIHRLIAESICGPDSAFETDWMRRGKEIEPQARLRLEIDLGVDLDQVGFVMTDDGRVGCSPDGLADGFGVEIKCPKPETHIKYLLGSVLPLEHKQQVHGGMWICERPKWLFMSYHPQLRPFYVWVERDAYTDKLQQSVTEFCDRLDKAKAKVDGLK